MSANGVESGNSEWPDPIVVLNVMSSQRLIPHRTGVGRQWEGS